MNPDMTPEELLLLAQGVTAEGQQLKTKQELIDFFLQPFGQSNSERKQFITRRRQFRKAIFTVRWKMHYNQTNLTPEEVAVKEIIDARIDPNRGLTWANFTYQWDVSPNPQTPGKVIQKHEWFKDGGEVDSDIGSFYPAAFTEQGI